MAKSEVRAYVAEVPAKDLPRGIYNPSNGLGHPDGPIVVTRSALVSQLLDMIPLSIGRDCVLVALDGPPAAGKSTLAADLRAALLAAGRPAIVISMDGFLAPRAVRYRHGHDGGDQYADAFAYHDFERCVIGPLRRGGSYCPAVYDVERDAACAEAWHAAPAGSVVLVEGIFMHRPELARHWATSVYLDVQQQTWIPRATRRGRHPREKYEQRSAPAEGRYLAEAQPHLRASIVIKYDDIERPVIVSKGPAAALLLK